VAYGVLRTLRDTLAPGSYMAVSQATPDGADDLFLDDPARSLIFADVGR